MQTNLIQVQHVIKSPHSYSCIHPAAQAPPTILSSTRSMKRSEDLDMEKGQKTGGRCIMARAWNVWSMTS